MEEITQPAAQIHIRHLSGRNPVSGQFASSMLAQFRQALTEGSSALQQHGCTLHDVTRIVCTVDGTQDFSSCFTTLNELFGPTCPAMTFRLVRAHASQGQRIELDLVATPMESGSPTG